jgi:Type II secretion system (T2SS), protein E, N-terminal domain
MRQVEEALARQVIYGGDLVTNLLEVARVDEVVLTELLAESMRLAPAPAGELPPASEQVRSLVPREVALERNLVPLEVQADGKLVLAVAEPLPAELLEQLRFALGMSLEQRAAPVVRVQQAVARAYGVPLERRMVRLIARLSGVTAITAPPPVVESTAARDAASAVTVPVFVTATPGVAVAGRIVAPARGHKTTSPGFPATRLPADGAPLAATEPAHEPVAALAQTSPALEAAIPPGGGRVRTLDSAQASALASASASASASAPARTSASAATNSAAANASPVAPVDGVPSALLQRESAASPRTARRRRGPITIDVATHEADEAADRDALLDLFFDFSQQFFDYSALFLMHGDIAEGRDASGAGATRERVLGIGVPLDMPSMVSAARDKRLPVVAKAPADGLDAVLLGDLQRARDSEMAIVPLVVRTRAVAILIGDCGEAGIERASVQQVVAFAGIVGRAFERIIVRRKLDGFIAGGREGAVGRVPSSMVPSKPSIAAPPLSKGPGLAASVASKAGAPPPKASEPPAARKSASAPPVPFVPRRSAPPSHAATTGGSGLPPPAANVAVVRKIAGPPIPREEPEAPGMARAHIQTTPSRPPLRPSTPAGPPVEPKPSTPAGPPVRPSTPPAPAVQAVEALRPSTPPAPQVEVVEVEESDDTESAHALFDELGWQGTRVHPEPLLPPSAAIAVPAHLPPAPVAPSAALPSVIVDDLDRELVAMVDRLASGEVDDVAEGELLRQGERAMRALMSRFPGPIAFSRARIATTSVPPRASECGPILRLVARERRVALPFVLARLDAPDAEARGWATHLLSELPYVEAIPHLLPRLRDSDASVCASAAHALAAIARIAPEPVRDALAGLSRSGDPADRAAAVSAMAKLREASFVPDLVRALGDANDGVVEAARRALVKVTRQDLGTDARRWVRWWEQNAGKHRVEWLIDALGHEVAEIRKSAGEELRALTKEYFGYAGDLPVRDRDRAQQRYRDWWIMEGRTRFRGP